MERTEPYSAISRRFAAFVIDGLLLLIPNLLMHHVMPVLGGVLLWLLYAPFFESSRIQATIGKRAMRIQVTDLQGGRISFTSALVRNLMKLVSSALLFLGHFVAFFTSRKQALHDIVADTVVVDGERRGVAFDAWAEQLRAVFNIGQNIGQEGGTRSPGPPSGAITGELERLQALREKGALTEDEFQEAKRRVLGSKPGGL